MVEGKGKLSLPAEWSGCLDKQEQVSLGDTWINLCCIIGFEGGHVG